MEYDVPSNRVARFVVKCNEQSTGKYIQHVNICLLKVLGRYIHICVCKDKTSSERMHKKLVMAVAAGNAIE